MKTIRLINSKAGWLARYDDVEVIAAFGTDTIPTAFLETCSPMEVKKAIQKLTKDYLVLFATA